MYYSIKSSIRIILVDIPIEISTFRVRRGRALKHAFRFMHEPQLSSTHLHIICYLINQSAIQPHRCQNSGLSACHHVTKEVPPHWHQLRRKPKRTPGMPPGRWECCRVSQLQRLFGRSALSSHPSRWPGRSILSYGSQHPCTALLPPCISISS